jgi:hypothetical protein
MSLWTSTRLSPALDFVEVIEQAVGSCDALIALIGNQWLTITDDSGRRRLDNPEDFVRLEIAAALARNIRVIPALVPGTRMPRSTDLPDVLRMLARRNAHEISDRRFHYPYRPPDGREDLAAGQEERRVLRGGAFYLDRRSVRCACRFRYGPYHSDWNVGFRVVVLPAS